MKPIYKINALQWWQMEEWSEDKVPMGPTCCCHPKRGSRSPPHFQAAPPESRWCLGPWTWELPGICRLWDWWSCESALKKPMKLLNGLRLGYPRGKIQSNKTHIPGIANLRESEGSFTQLAPSMGSWKFASEKKKKKKIPKSPLGAQLTWARGRDTLTSAWRPPLARQPSSRIEPQGGYSSASRGHEHGTSSPHNTRTCDAELGTAAEPRFTPGPLRVPRDQRNPRDRNPSQDPAAAGPNKGGSLKIDPEFLPSWEKTEEKPRPRWGNAFFRDPVPELPQGVEKKESSKNPAREEERGGGWEGEEQERREKNKKKKSKVDNN